MGREVKQCLSVITLEGCDPKARWHGAAKLFSLCLKPWSLEETGLWLLGADWLAFAHENHPIPHPKHQFCSEKPAEGRQVYTMGTVGCCTDLKLGGLEAGTFQMTLLQEKESGRKVLLGCVIVVWGKLISKKCQYNMYKCNLKLYRQNRT